MEEKTEMKTRKGTKRVRQKRDVTNRGSPEPSVLEDRIEGEALEINASKEDLDIGKEQQITDTATPKRKAEITLSNSP